MLGKSVSHYKIIEKIGEGETAVAYEQQGEKDKAMQEYGKFLTIWKEADTGIAEVEDAEGEVEKIER